MRNRFQPRVYAASDRWAAAVALVLTPVYYIFPWDSAASVRAAAGVPFVFLYAAFLPGYVLAARILTGPSDTLMKITASAFAGIAWFMVVAFVWALTGLSLGLFHFALPVLILVTMALAVVKRRRVAEEDPAPVFDDAGSQDTQAKTISAPSGAEKTALAAFALLLAVIFALVLRSGPPVVFTADTLDHVAYVSEIAETQEPFPTTAYYKDPGENGADLRKGLLHVFYGFSSAYLRLDSLTVITWMNALLAVLLLLSVYAAGVTLFASRAVGILSSLVFLVALDGGLMGSAIRQSFYTHRFGIAFLLAVLAHGLAYLDTGKRRELVPVAVFSFAAIATHIFFGVLIAVAGITIAVWKCCFPQNRAGEHLSRVFGLGLAAFAGLAPYGIFRYLTAWPGPNDLHKGVQGVVLITKSLYIADPIQEFGWFGFVGVLSFLSVFVLWKHRGKSAGLGYVYASFFTWALVLLNPLLLPPVRSVLTYLIARLNFLCPFYFAAAWFLVAFFSRRHRDIRRNAFGQILVAAFAAALVYNILPVIRGNTFSRTPLEAQRRTSYLAWKDALDAIDKTLPEGSVIASDPLTSYSLTAFTPYRTLCTFDQHAPPNDARLGERIQAARDILSPYVPIERTTALLAEHGATHVIVNGRFPANVRIEYWSMATELFPEITGKFERHPEAFERISDVQGFAVYAWNGTKAAADSSFSRPYIVGALPDDQSWSRVGKLAGEAVLEGTMFSEGPIAPGGTMDIAFAWSGRGDYDFRNYAVAVRFDYVNPDLPLGGKPFPKVARKFKEKATGRLYRFSDFHKVRNGFLSPDSWPPGEIVLDETRVHIPETAAPGQYTVSVKLMTLQHQPTYHARDLFFDDDVYAGIPVGRVTIR